MDCRCAHLVLRGAFLLGGCNAFRSVWLTLQPLFPSCDRPLLQTAWAPHLRLLAAAPTLA